MDNNEAVIAGTIQSHRQNWDTGGGYINVVYGIESYFVPEGEGRDIEKEIVKQRVTVELSIDKYGYASVSKIFIDGVQLRFR